MKRIRKKRSDESENIASLEHPASTAESFDLAPVAETFASEDAVTDAVSSALSESNGEPSATDASTPLSESVTEPVPEQSVDVALDECASVPAAASSVSEESDPLAAEENVPSMDEETLRKMMERRESRHNRRKREKRSRIFLAAEGRDIRYRGPLSYRGLRIAAWVAILMWQIGLWLSLGSRVDAGFAEMIGFWPTVFTACRSLMTPLFLTATFAIILNNSRRFRSLLFMYGGFALLIVALFILVHDRYILGILMNVLDLTREEAVDLIQLVIVTASENGSFSFNIFVDLFLCTLFTCFVVYRPKRFFVGKKLIIFRLFALLPAAYEIASIVLKALASVGTIIIPTYFFPFLTTKPPMTFLLFVSLTFFIKRREWLFRRNGKTREEYETFLGTNLNSLHFSTFVAEQFVVFAILDLLMMVILSFAVVGQFSTSEEPFAAAVGVVSSWGFGDCVALIFVIPFILLFSYTRTHKDTRPDIVINLVGVALVVLVHLEALYEGIIMELDTIKGMLGT